MSDDKITFRTKVKKSDLKDVHQILESTKFFHDFEVQVAVELVEEALSSGPESGYNFIFAEVDKKTVGFTCWGQIACTKHSYDIYWIGVHNDCRGGGIGKKILAENERLISELGGIGVYLETSSTEKYKPTQEFYIRCNYIMEARIKDFYDEGDDKLIYVKRFR